MPASSSQTPTSENLREFKLWVRDVLRRPFIWEAQREGIEFENPADLPGFIEVILNAEKGCTYNLQDLNQQIRYDRQETRGRETSIGLIVCAEESTFWKGRKQWLQASRQHLEQQQQRRGGATGRHEG
jgi:hypothetical protein